MQAADGARLFVEPLLVEGHLEVAGLVAEGEEAELAHVALEHDPPRRLDDRPAVVAHLRAVRRFDGRQRRNPFARPGRTGRRPAREALSRFCRRSCS